MSCPALQPGRRPSHETCACGGAAPAAGTLQSCSHNALRSWRAVTSHAAHRCTLVQRSGTCRGWGAGRRAGRAPRPAAAPRASGPRPGCPAARPAARPAPARPRAPPQPPPRRRARPRAPAPRPPRGPAGRAPPPLPPHLCQTSLPVPDCSALCGPSRSRSSSCARARPANRHQCTSPSVTLPSSLASTRPSRMRSPAMLMCVCHTQACFCSSRAAAPDQDGARAAPASPPRRARRRPPRRRCWQHRRRPRRRPSQSPRAPAPRPPPSAGAAPRQPHRPLPPRRRPAARRPPELGCLGAAGGHGGRLRCKRPAPPRRARLKATAVTAGLGGGAFRARICSAATQGRTVP